MTWISFISNLFKGGLLLLAYSLGLKSEKTDIENKTSKLALDEANKAFLKQQGIKSKYDKLKVNLPNEWGTINSPVFSSKGSVSKADKASVRSGGK